MKKFAAALLSAMIAIVFTGCSMSQAVPSASPSLQTPATATPTETGIPDTAASQSPTEQKVYFGTFEVTEEAASGVSTYSQTDIDEMIGKTLRFSSDEAVILNDQPSASPVEMKNPQYSESTLAVDDFESAFKISAAQLGLTEGDITKVDISDPTGATSGSTLILQDNKVLIAAGGVYFVLSRIA